MLLTCYKTNNSFDGGRLKRRKTSMEEKKLNKIKMIFELKQMHGDGEEKNVCHNLVWNQCYTYMFWYNGPNCTPCTVGCTEIL